MDHRPMNQAVWDDPAEGDPLGYGQDFHENAPGEGLKAKGARLANIGGAVMSLALIAGLGVWGYKITVRDVTGVPVVQALEGPMRVAPEDPGGEVADHTGLAVNQVAAEGEAEELPDEIALAPAPVELAEEDLPLAAMVQAEIDDVVEEVVTPASEAADGELVAPELEVAAKLPDDVDPNDPVAVALAMAGKVAEGAEPLTGEVVEAEEEEELDPEAARLAKLPGVKRSLRPVKRPAELKAPAPEDVVEVSAQTAPAEAEVARAGAVPAGTRLVQLGAFETPEEAATLWERLTGDFDALMAEKARLIMEAESGGKTFYRLRAQGFADLSDARRFCAALVAEKAECIPVVAR